MVIACCRRRRRRSRTLTLRPRTRESAASGLLLATEVADYLVGKGLPFRTAHEVSGRIVRELHQRRSRFSVLSLADWQRLSRAFDAGVFAAITPEAAVAARQTPQSTNPAAVAAALAETRELAHVPPDVGGDPAVGIRIEARARATVGQRQPPYRYLQVLTDRRTGSAIEIFTAPAAACPASPVRQFRSMSVTAAISSRRPASWRK